MVMTQKGNKYVRFNLCIHASTADLRSERLMCCQTINAREIEKEKRKLVVGYVKDSESIKIE